MKKSPRKGKTEDEEEKRGTPDDTDSPVQKSIEQ